MPAGLVRGRHAAPPEPIWSPAGMAELEALRKITERVQRAERVRIAAVLRGSALAHPMGKPVWVPRDVLLRRLADRVEAGL